MLKSLTLAFLAAALLCALPAAAASNPAQPAVPSACPQPAPLFDFAAPQPNATPALPAWLTDPTPATTPTTTTYRGYCACECSRIKDCNTDADCSNHRCLGAISCC
jgi:hypothetical protein